MAIYNKNGQVLSNVYNVNGQEQPKAYDINGAEIFSNEPSNIKVMTYNVGGWYIGSGTNVPADKDEQYYNLQRGMIVNNDPDILILQEYWTTFSQAGRSALTMLKDLFPYVKTVKGTDQWYGHAICSKYPLTGYTEHIYSNSAKRYYDSCTITVGATSITVLNTHLDVQSQSARTEQINQLIPFLEQKQRFIIGGDFNAMITDSTANTSSTPYIENVKPFVDAGFNTANFGSFGFLLTCVDRTNGTHYYLDNIYTSSNLTITDAYVDDTKLNDLIDDPIDHMPLIATIEL